MSQGMNGQDSAEVRRVFGELTAPGRSSFDWAVLCATLALAFPVSGFLGLFFADRSRRRGYGRWKAAAAVCIWCAFVGIVVRGFFHMGVLP